MKSNSVKKSGTKASSKNGKAEKETKPQAKNAEVAKPAKAQKTALKAVKRKQVDLPKGYKPTEKEEYMNDFQQEYFRQKLVSWKEELLSESRETLDHLREENWNEPDINDRATVETEAALELRTRDRYRKLINKIDSAIRRIDTGDYGFCEETGEPIGIKRLEARPTATLSIEAQQRHEREEKKYNDDDWRE